VGHPAGGRLPAWCGLVHRPRRARAARHAMLPHVSNALLRYRATTLEVDPLVRRDELSAAEWTGMLLDRARVPIWDGVAVRAGQEVTAGLRLAALSDLVPQRGVVGRAAAAWVHAGGPRPTKVDVVVPPGVRRPDPHPLRRAAEGPLPDEDVLDLGPGRVTTVQRTGVDVARFAAPGDVVRLLVGLLPLGFDPHAALAAMRELRGGRGVQRARTLLAELQAVLPPALDRAELRRG